MFVLTSEYPLIIQNFIWKYNGMHKHILGTTTWFIDKIKLNLFFLRPVCKAKNGHNCFSNKAKQKKCEISKRCRMKKKIIHIPAVVHIKAALLCYIVVQHDVRFHLALVVFVRVCMNIGM